MVQVLQGKQEVHSPPGTSDLTEKPPDMCSCRLYLSAAHAWLSEWWEQNHSRPSPGKPDQYCYSLLFSSQKTCKTARQTITVVVEAKFVTCIVKGIHMN